MVCIQAKDYWFRYPEQAEYAVKIGTWELERGAFCLLTGESGSGKTTLLRQLSRDTMLQGECGGVLEVDSRRTGYVWQDPGSQIVTDWVEYEIVFGMENQGLSRDLMQRRLAELVTFFGLEHLLGRDTMQLSGGEMQTLNVAAALAVNPDLLLLDEPTSQLDPVASRNLVDLLRRVHEELGTTIVIAEQRLEDLVALADEMVLMERGRIRSEGTPQNVFWQEKDTVGNMFFPSYMRVFGDWETEGEVPRTPGEARKWFEKSFMASARTGEECAGAPVKISSATGENPGQGNKNRQRSKKLAERSYISCRNISFRYEKSTPDVLRDCSCEFPLSAVTCLAGGNGSGKSTLLELLSGRYAPYRGKIRNLPASLVLLPQSVDYLFLHDTAEEEWNVTAQAEEYARRFHLSDDRAACSPVDLSGGERQRLGLSVILGREADGYLLDEPTRGLDDISKIVLGEILLEKKAAGKTVLFVSHDMEFAAYFADFMALMFQGKIPLLTEKYLFFTENQFYTTGISRITRGVSGHIITREDVAEYAKKKNP